MGGPAGGRWDGQGTPLIGQTDNYNNQWNGSAWLDPNTGKVWNSITQQFETPGGGGANDNNLTAAVAAQEAYYMSTGLYTQAQAHAQALKDFSAPAPAPTTTTGGSQPVQGQLVVSGGQYYYVPPYGGSPQPTGLSADKAVAPSVVQTDQGIRIVDASSGTSILLPGTEPISNKTTFNVPGVGTFAFDPQTGQATPIPGTAEQLTPDQKAQLGINATQAQTGQFGAETSRATGMGQLALSTDQLIQQMATSPKDLFGLYFQQRGINPDFEAMRAGRIPATGTGLVPTNPMSAYTPTTPAPQFPIQEWGAQGAAGGTGGAGGGTPAPVAKPTPNAQTVFNWANGPGQLTAAQMANMTPEQIAMQNMQSSQAYVDPTKHVTVDAQGRSVSDPYYETHQSPNETLAGFNARMAANAATLQQFYDMQGIKNPAGPGDSTRIMGSQTGSGQTPPGHVTGGPVAAPISTPFTPYTPPTGVSQKYLAGMALPTTKGATAFTADQTAANPYLTSGWLAPNGTEKGQTAPSAYLPNLPAGASYQWNSQTGQGTYVSPEDNAKNIPGYEMAMGGMTTAPAFVTGDHPSGMPTGNEETVINPTGAPLQVIPNQQSLSWAGQNTPGGPFGGGLPPQNGMPPQGGGGMPPMSPPAPNSFGGNANPMMDFAPPPTGLAGNGAMMPPMNAGLGQAYGAQANDGNRVRQLMQLLTDYGNRLPPDTLKNAIAAIPHLALGTGDTYMGGSGTYGPAGVGQDNSQAYYDAGMGGSWINSTDNAYANSMSNLPLSMRMLSDYGAPLAPGLVNAGTGTQQGMANVANPYNLGRQGGVVPSLQGYNRMTPGEQQTYQGYAEGVVGVPWADLMDFMGKPTQNLQKAAVSKGI